MLRLIKDEEVRRHKFANRSDVVYDRHCKVGDVVELKMFTSLKKQKTHIIAGLVVKRKGDCPYDTKITIRNSDPDGLVVMRTYPLFSPWICGLRIKKRFKVKCKDKDLSEIMLNPKFNNPEIFD